MLELTTVRHAEMPRPVLGFIPVKPQKNSPLILRITQTPAGISRTAAISARTSTFQNSSGCFPTGPSARPVRQAEWRALAQAHLLASVGIKLFLRQAGQGIRQDGVQYLDLGALAAQDGAWMAVSLSDTLRRVREPADEFSGEPLSPSLYPRRTQDHPNLPKSSELHRMNWLYPIDSK